MRRILLALLLIACAAAAFARVGGGQSYSGGSSSSSSSSRSSSSYSSSGSSYSGSSSSYSGSSGAGAGNDIGGCIIGIVFLIFIIVAVIAVIRTQTSQVGRVVIQMITSPPPGGRAVAPPRDALESLRRYDPNFSRPVFEDFCYSLYQCVYHARGAGDLGRYAPYLSPDALRMLTQRTSKDLTEVRGIVVGALNIAGLQGLTTAVVTVDVDYEANMTEVINGREQSWYVRERWTYERRRDILSPPPAKAKADHCPRCGAPLDTRADGACAHCGAKINDGSFQWYVRRIYAISREPRGPLLTSDVPEAGTDLPTRNAGLPEQRKKFMMTHPSFKWDDFREQVRRTAYELQKAWSDRDWERARSLETETLFQTHRYWIDAYIKQHLRNIVDDYSVEIIEAAKISSDAFYDALTVRLWASGRDYTGDDNGVVVAGSRENTRRWSEYWAFIRTRGTEAEPGTKVSCPNCGASVEVGATGVCKFCGGKLTSGEFGWLLSRIEQDEAYSG